MKEFNILINKLFYCDGVILPNNKIVLVRGEYVYIYDSFTDFINSNINYGIFNLDIIFI